MNTNTAVASHVPPAVRDSFGQLIAVGDKVAYAARGWGGNARLRLATVIGILQDQSGFALKLHVRTPTGGSRNWTMRNFNRMAKI